MLKPDDALVIVIGSMPEDPIDTGVPPGADWVPTKRLKYSTLMYDPAGILPLSTCMRIVMSRDAVPELILPGSSMAAEPFDARSTSAVLLLGITVKRADSPAKSDEFK